MSRTFCLALLTSLSVAAVAFAEDPPAAPAPVAIGATVPDFTTRDEQGRPFQLHKSTHTRAEIEASVRAAAAQLGAAKDAPLSTKIADLPGVKDEEGELDGERVKALLCAAGAFYGMTATQETGEGLQTLADVASWIAAANEGPILFIIWSPNCPAVKAQNDRMVEFAANHKVRTYCIASNTRDTEEHYAKHRENFEFAMRVFPDREQKVTDLLGGKKTPHYMLVDAKHVLRYRGALDNDAMGFMDEAERENWLGDAVAAVRAGKDVAKSETEPGG